MTNNISPYFGTPILASKCPELTEEDTQPAKDYFLDLFNSLLPPGFDNDKNCLDFKLQAFTGEHGGNWTGDRHQNNSQLLGNELFKPIRDTIIKNTRDFLKTIAYNDDQYDIVIMKSWPVLTTMEVPPHKHNSADFSAVYYLKTPFKTQEDFDTSEVKASGPVVVYSPHTNCWGVSTVDISDDIMPRPVACPPLENHLLIFPSFLRHAVAEYRIADYRWSISADIKIIKHSGYNEDVLTPPSKWLTDLE